MKTILPTLCAICLLAAKLPATDLLIDTPDLANNIEANTTHNSVTFTENALRSTLHIRNGSTLTIDGNGILNNAPNRNSTDSPYVRVSGGSILNFTDTANASLGNQIRLINTDGTIRFDDGTTAGNAFLVNQSANRGGPSDTIIFAGDSSAGNSTIINYGQNTLVRFEGSAQSGATAIHNRDNFSQTIFAEQSTLTAGTRIHNNGTGSSIRFIDDAEIFGSAANFTKLKATGAYSTANVAGNAALINNGSRSSIYLGGKTHAENLIIGFNTSGTYGVVQIADGFTADNLFIAATVNATLVHIQGNATDKVRLNGNVEIYANGDDPVVYIGDNVLINAHGNLTSNGAAELVRAQVIIGGNAILAHNGSTAYTLRLRLGGNNYGAQYTINGSAQITNAQISIGGGRNFNTIADPDNPNSANIFNVRENARITTTQQAIVGGNFAHLTFADEAAYTSTNNINISGNYSSLTIRDDATVNVANITLSGRNSTINVLGGHLSTTSAGTLGGANATITLGGNANITGVGGGTAIFNLTGTDSLTVIRDNATIANGRLDFYNVTANLRIEGSPDLSTATLIFRNGNRVIDLALDKGYTLAIDNIGNVGAANITTFHFTGNANQTLQYDRLQNQPNFAFTEDPGLRATVIHNNATVSYALQNQNTITGEFVIAQGTVIANHTQALDTATLNLTGGTLSYGSNITVADELTLGGLSGNGTLSATISEIKIGNNNYDSEFSGTLSGGGNIVKIGDGTLSLRNITTTAYTGQVAVTGGKLRISGTVQFNTGTTLTLAPDTQLVFDLATATALTLDTLALDNNGQVAVTLADPATSAGDFDNILTVTTLNIADGSTLDGAQVRALNSARQTYTLTLNGANYSYDLKANELLPFAAFAGTSNQVGVAAALTALEQVAATAPLITQLNNTASAAALTAALSELNPAGLVAMSTIARRQAAADLRLITQRTQQRAAGTGFARTRASSAASASAFSSYFSLRHNQGTQDSTPDSPGFDIKTNGITIGIDTSTPRSLIGVQLACEQSEADLDRLRGEVETDSIRLIGYAAWLKDNGLWLQAHASVNVHEFDTTRNLPTFGGQNKADGVKGLGITGSVELGKTFNFTRAKIRTHGKRIPPPGAWSHAPYARLTYDMLKIDSFTEEGAAPASIGEQKPLSLVSRLAWRLQWKTTSSETHILVSLDLGWEHEYLDREQKIDFRFIGAPNGGRVHGARTNRNSFVGGLNIGASTAKAVYLALAYDFDYNSDFTDHRLTFSLGKKF